VSKNEIIDPAVANAAFALRDGEVSAPVQGRFGAVIVTVTKIEPEQGKSLADVAPQIRNEIATERAKADVRSLHEKIEDERAGGASLPQIAEKLKLTIATYDVDRSGRDPNGKVANFPHAGQVIPAAFNSDVGADNDPLEADGGYVWYNIAGITPSRDRTLDEVKDQVEARWREDEVAARLKAKSAELLDKLKAGTAFDAVAASAGLKVQTADKLTRAKPQAGVSPRVIAAVFRTAKDAYGGAEGDQPTEWVVFRVTDISTPKFDASSPEIKRVADLLKKQQSDEILEQYMAWLQNELGTTVNQAALAQALGNNGPDTN
jgi:peptidyl-prolyl cis-trans isomerase D